MAVECVWNENGERTIGEIASLHWKSLCHCYLYMVVVFAHSQSAALGKYGVAGLTPL